jgi:hypothetical protein
MRTKKTRGGYRSQEDTVRSLSQVLQPPLVSNMRSLFLKALPLVRLPDTRRGERDKREREREISKQ